MTSKLKVNLINDSGDNNLITSDGSGSVTLGAAFPAVGKIGQVLSTIGANFLSTSSTSYAAVSGLSLSITPSSTSSKVLVLHSAPSVEIAQILQQQATIVQVCNINLKLKVMVVLYKY